MYKLILIQFLLSSSFCFALDLDKERDIFNSNMNIPIDLEVAKRFVKSNLNNLAKYRTGQVFYRWQKSITVKKCIFEKFRKISYLKVFSKLGAAIVEEDDFYLAKQKNCQKNIPVPKVMKEKEISYLKYLPTSDYKKSYSDIFPAKGKYTFYKTKDDRLLRVNRKHSGSGRQERVLFDLSRPQLYLKSGWSCSRDRKRGCFNLTSNLKDLESYLETYANYQVLFYKIANNGLVQKKILAHKFSAFNKMKDRPSDPHYRYLEEMISERRYKENAYDLFKREFLNCVVYQPRSANTLASECVGRFLDSKIGLGVTAKNRYAECKKPVGETVGDAHDLYFAAENHYCLLTWYKRAQKWHFKRHIKKNALPGYLKGIR
ncbi:MAG: hypothetical protein HN509_07545 [Halobacteriovoraceae bacterium]|jgi:hypothetical protein|nr:hypothetical protein [Halobacteriovoraceae bacterium]